MNYEIWEEKGNEQMKKIELNQLCKLHQDYVKVYKKIKMADVNTEGVQLSDKAFLNYFETYEVIERSMRELPYQLEKVHNGVKFYCLISAKKALEIFIKEPTQYIQDREEFFI